MTLEEKLKNFRPKDFLPAELETELQRSAYEARILGEAWAVAQGVADSISDRRSDYLGALAASTEGKSEAERERVARTLPDWGNFQTDLSSKKAEALKLKIKYDAAKRKWETLKTLIYIKQLEMKTNI